MADKGPLAGPNAGAGRSKLRHSVSVGPSPSVGHTSPPGRLGGHHVIDPRAVRRGNRPQSAKGGK
jgi:hypothetical protein